MVDEKKIPEKRKLPDNNVTIGLIAANFPLDMFDEWEADCKKNYGNCRWMKIWNDHLAAKIARSHADVISEVFELTKRIDELEAMVGQLTARMDVNDEKNREPEEQKDAVTLDGKTFR